MKKPVYSLKDKDDNFLGTVQIQGRTKEENYLGKINFIAFPEKLRQLFKKYEACVNAQLFTYLDDLDTKINSWGLNLDSIGIYDVQIMNTNDISFKALSSITIDLKKTDSHFK